jgi:RING finger protein 121
MEWMFTLFTYGFYFGVLSKDLVDICSDRMASSHCVRDGLAVKILRDNICAICGSPVDSIPPTESLERRLSEVDQAYKDLDDEEQELKELLKDDASPRRLDCGHVFHSACIRGWLIVGKRDMCPYCKEKVDLSRFKKSMMDQQGVLYVAFLEWIRYLIVWQPIVLMIVQATYAVLRLS